MSKLGLVFKQLRKAQQMRQIDMATALQERGVDIKTKTGISHIEHRGTQKHQVVTAYEDIFNVSVADLIARSDLSKQ